MNNDSFANASDIVETLAAVKGKEFAKFVTLICEVQAVIDMAAHSGVDRNSREISDAMTTCTLNKMLNAIARLTEISERDAVDAKSWAKRIADRF